ncbi:MAG: molybdopterin-dependent oxidoreductase [Candidatus Eremiobacteraeota bacterium]|nr:molybdopterin-dependent oxidoreductase [Candidatus Eremiobacteraeota bacterium]
MKTFFKENRTAVIAGFIGGAAMSMFWLATRLVFGLGTPSELFLDRMAPFINAHLFGTFIAVFGGYTHLKVLGFLSVFFGQLLVGVAGGVLYRVAQDRANQRFALLAFAVFSVLLLLLVCGALYPQLYTNYRGNSGKSAVIWSLLNLLAGILCYACFTLVAFRVLDQPQSLGAISRSRRSFMQNTSVAILSISNIGLLIALYRRATFAYDGTVYMGEDVMPVTPNDRFYQVTKNVIDPQIDLGRWHLAIGGHVACSKTFSLHDLRGLPAVEQETTLMCISNPVGGGLMSNARWKGVPLAALLHQVIPADKAGRVLLRAADGYTDTIYFDKALELTTIIAYEMNGEALPHLHGYPVRMIVPGLFGEKNVKWLTGIEIVPHTIEGFYEKQGWGPDFKVPTQSRIDVPTFAEPLSRNKDVQMRGVAFGGDRGVSRVEVSVDGARTWRMAQITYSGGKLAWALWTFVWRPTSAGTYAITVRAVDGLGAVQIATERANVPEGATGYHRVRAMVA